MIAAMVENHKLAIFWHSIVVDHSVVQRIDASRLFYRCVPFFKFQYTTARAFIEPQAVKFYRFRGSFLCGRLALRVTRQFQQNTTPTVEPFSETLL
jgi:hypothetical protein